MKDNDNESDNRVGKMDRHKLCVATGRATEAMVCKSHVGL